MGESSFKLNQDGHGAQFVNDLSTICLEEKDGKTFGVVSNAIYTGDFKHHQGNFNLTEKHLDDFVTNFENKKIGIEPAINYNHDMFEKAAGWPTKLTKKTTQVSLSDGTEQKQVTGLDMQVEWTPAAAKAIRDGEYKYFSIEFSFDFVNSETQEKVKNVVTGGALTNKPFLKGTGVKTLQEKNKEGELMSTKKELMLSLKEDHEVDVEKLLHESKSLEASKKEVKQLSEELESLKAEKLEAEQKAEAEKKEHLLSELVKEGKIYKSELETFQKFFSLLPFEEVKEEAAKLQVKVKFEAAGSSENHAYEGDLSEDEKLHQLAEKISKKQEISFGDAYKIAVRNGGNE